MGEEEFVIARTTFVICHATFGREARCGTGWFGEGGGSGGGGTVSGFDF